VPDATHPGIRRGQPASPKRGLAYSRYNVNTSYGSLKLERQSRTVVQLLKIAFQELYALDAVQPSVGQMVSICQSEFSLTSFSVVYSVPFEARARRRSCIAWRNPTEIRRTSRNYFGPAAWRWDCVGGGLAVRLLFTGACSEILQGGGKDLEFELPSESLHRQAMERWKHRTPEDSPLRYNRSRRSLEKLAHNGLAGRGHFARVSHLFDAVPGV
jgi:hypothetical protein